VDKCPTAASRRWSVEELGACFVGRDHNGQKLSYVYFEDEPGRQSAAKLLTKDEARRIAVNIARLALGSAEWPREVAALAACAASSLTFPN
jgi:DNA-binding LacI/PurR family transcriptional regulator